ncbi:MAG TPA: S9 family peptidase [Terriglobia bacterium]|nr:S9 family peptidase [Terriglobia bacterium]
MPRKSMLVLIALMIASALFAGEGKKQLTVDSLSHLSSIVPAGPEHIAWRPHSDDFSFTEKDGDTVLWLYNASTGTKRMLLDGDSKVSSADLDSYQWSPDGSRVLLEGGGKLWLVPVASGAPQSIDYGGSQISDVAFSPQGDKIGFVRDNNIYALDLKSGRARQITTDGSASLLNGHLDWVYGEELAYRETTRAYEWSPDGRKIAYLQLDDAPVPEYPLTRFLKDHVSIFDQRYPQPGDPNPAASMHIVQVNGRSREQMFRLSGGDEYIVPSFVWTPDSKSVCFLTLNRDQTRETVILWDGKTARRPVIESDPYWINNVEAPQFVDGGQEFLWLSERDGWNHLYLYTREGKLVSKLTSGDWMIDHPMFQDVPSYQIHQAGQGAQANAANDWVYFESTKPDPRERQIDRVRLDGTGFEQLTHEHGTHALTLSPDGRYLIDQFSSVSTPPVARLLKSDGTFIADIDKPANHLSEYALGKTDFLTLRAGDGSTLYARLVKPPNFDPEKKYPVIVDVYGGPGVEIVRNQWGATSSMDQLFAEHGFLIWSLDNHGSEGRGHAWETTIFKDMGKRELADQLLGVEFLKSQPYVDASRIGIFGWSYGGYMTLYALTRAPDVFKCGVAGAPVTDWHYYDSIYTERYMRTPDENPQGYQDSSDVLAAGRLRAKLLLIHGVADDNVHMMNTINFINALIQNRIPYQLYLQPSQKHGFSDPAAIWYRNERIFEFFMHNL